MSIQGAPQGQIAYQTVLQKYMQAAWSCYAKTANRYGAGTGQSTPVGLGLTGATNAPVWALVRAGKKVLPMPVGGQAAAVSSTGGSGYASSDTVTLTAPNGGRNIVVKVTGVSGGAPTGWTILDPGSGLLGGGDGKNNYFSSAPAGTVLTQLSTSGSGSGATWTAVPGFGFLFPQPMPSA